MNWLGKLKDVTASAGSALVQKATELLTYKSKLDEVEKRWLDITNARDGILAQKLIPEGELGVRSCVGPPPMRALWRVMVGGIANPKNAAGISRLTPNLPWPLDRS